MPEYKVFTTQYREKLRLALKNSQVLPAPATIGFGTGGYDYTNSVVLEPDANATAMTNPYGVKSFTSIYDDGDYKVFTGTIDRQEYNGYGISQVGVFDSGGDLIALINFSEITKIAGALLPIRIRWGA